MQIITRKPTAQFVTMTEELVEALLSLNTRNRSKRALVVSSYQRAIEAGMWVTTNQGIGVSASGFLVDGQHRLDALRCAGYPEVQMLVVTGLPDEAISAVDAGTNRTARDYLQLMFDTKISALVAAVLRTSMMAQDDFASIKYQPQEYAAHLELVGESLHEVLKVDPSIYKCPAAVVAALVDAHHKGYRSDVKAFAMALVTGEMLGRDSPALTLRNWIASNKGRGGADTMVDRYRKTVRALQAWIDHRPLSKLYSTKTSLSAPKTTGSLY